MADDSLYLPRRKVAKLARSVLPGDAELTTDAEEALQECASEFIAFITSEAHDGAMRDRAPLSGRHVVAALDRLGMWPLARATDKFVGKLELLQRYQRLRQRELLEQARLLQQQQQQQQQQQRQEAAAAQERAHRMLQLSLDSGALPSAPTLPPVPAFGGSTAGGIRSGGVAGGLMPPPSVSSALPSPGGGPL